MAGRPWAPDGRWAHECRLVVPTADAEAVDRLRGVFNLVRLDQGRSGFVVSDPIGLSFTYLADGNGATAVSSVASLAAQAISPTRHRPPLDALGVCGLAYSTYRIGDRTGFDGVRTIPAGSSISVDPTAGATLVEGPLPWLANPVAATDRAGALDLILGEVTESVTSTLTVPADSYIADLTGGKDSRLVLAAALHGGVAEHFTFHTDGPPELADVRVAASLADQLRVRHEAGLRVPHHQTGYPERLSAFVAATGGITNAWSLRLPEPRPIDVRVSGLNGECLRAHAIVIDPLTSDDDLVRYFNDVLRFGRLGLVRPEPAKQYREEALTMLLQTGTAGREPLDKLESFQIRTALEHGTGHWLSSDGTIGSSPSTPFLQSGLRSRSGRESARPSACTTSSCAACRPSS